MSSKLDVVKDALALVFDKVTTSLGIDLGTEQQQEMALSQFCPQVILDLSGRPEAGVLIDLPRRADTEAGGQAWVPVYIGPGLSPQGAAADWLRAGHQHPIDSLVLAPSSQMIWVTVRNETCTGTLKPAGTQFWSGAENEAKYMAALDLVVRSGPSIQELAERSLRIQKRLTADASTVKDKEMAAKLVRLGNAQGELEAQRALAIQAYQESADAARAAANLANIAAIFKLAAAVAGASENAAQANAVAEQRRLELNQINQRMYDHETMMLYLYQMLKMQAPVNPYLHIQGQEVPAS